MKLHFLGTCCGAEPIPDRRHASVVLEYTDRLFWLDAGEACSITGHTMGLDLLKTTNILISHCHMDHIGGLANLLWTIRKLRVRTDRLPTYGGVDVYIPNPVTKNAVNSLLSGTEENFKCDFPVNLKNVSDGFVLYNNGLTITAYHNNHLGNPGNHPWMSFSYRIKAEGKSIIYSGDLGNYSDLDIAIGHGCDVILLETGHFKIEQAYEYLKNKEFGRLFFTHNGREIINDYEGSVKKVADLFGKKASICNDRTTINL